MIILTTCWTKCLISAHLKSINGGWIRKKAKRSQVQEFRVQGLAHIKHCQ
jgi:hypothetical protein